MTLGDIVARRRRSAETTRAEILAAARRRFLDESYENVGLRDIAKDAGIDVALVSRYFGSKEGLFREVLQPEEDRHEKFDIVLPPEEVPAYVVSLMEQKGECEDQEHVEKILTILRSASSPAAAQIIRETLHADVLEPFSKLVGGRDAETKAGLVLAILMGTTVLRTVMAVDAMASDDPEKMRKRMLRLFAAALADD